MTYIHEQGFRAAVAETQRLRTQALFAVHYANRSFVELGWSDPVYVAGRSAMDQIMLPLAEAKWLLASVDGSGWGFSPAAADPRVTLDRAKAGFLRAIQDSERVRFACERGRMEDLPVGDAKLEERAEIRFYGNTPVVPSIAPIVVLQGSNRDMGRQYVQQVVDIYGNWILRQQANLELTDVQKMEVERWATELSRHTPEILEFAEGMAEGAAGVGLAMSYLQALVIWTGTRPPSKEPRPMAFAQGLGQNVTAAYLGVDASAETDMCSGICAWGEGTRDGSLVAGSTTDHDCTFQATIVAFPNEGHAYIFTPFSANGFIPVLGEFHMSGHPGMNNQGLAYVHHAGANTGEPVDQWGYGVRRGPATFHLLQTCDSAAAARDAHKRFPVGDAGISLGSVGGIFADAGYGFALEARPGSPSVWKPILREHTFDAYGESFDFLYANNNALAPESGHLNVPPPEGYRYTIAGGWFTRDWAQINCEPGAKAFRRLNTRNSEGRNRYAYRMMMEGYGRIDCDYMTMVYRQSGEMPEGTPEEIQRLWQAGVPWNSSTAHRANAFTAIMNPRRGDDGVYRGCIGPANRAVEARGPEHGYYYFDETNAFWELRLRSNPLEVLKAAIDDGGKKIEEATRLIRTLLASHPGSTQFSAWLEEARRNLAEARQLDTGPTSHGSDAALLKISRALRRATRAQVRAKQICDALVPPPTTPAHLQPDWKKTP